MAFEDEFDKDFNRVLERIQKETGFTPSIFRKDKQIEIKLIIDKTLKACKQELINTPHAGLFNECVIAEMAHHWERWGDESEYRPQHFQMVLSYLVGKLIKAVWEKDFIKYEHHLITLAAVSGTAHKYLLTEGSGSNTWFKTK